VAAAVGAILAVAWAMFISAHDLLVLAVVVVAAASIGSVAALALGNLLGTDASTLRATARRIGAGGPVNGAHPHSEELAEVARAMEAMAHQLEECRENERALDASRRELV